MNLKEMMESMMGGGAAGGHSNCECPMCTGKTTQTLAAIRELLLDNLRKLEGIKPLLPIPGHLYRTPSGRKVLVCLKADEDKDYTLIDVNNGERATIQWTGEPYYKELGAVLLLGVDKLWVLVEDLGEVVAMK